MFQSNLYPIISNGSGEKVDFDGIAIFMPRHKKWRAIMLYPPNFCVSVRPSVRLSVRPSVRPSVSG